MTSGREGGSASVATLAGLLAAGDDEKPAIVTAAGVVLSHGRLRAEAARLANRLRSLGAGPGDRVAIVLGNGPEMAVAFLAAAAAGAAAPLNPHYRAEELEFYMNDLGVRVLITGPEGSAGAAAARQAASRSESVTLVTLVGPFDRLELEPEARPAAPAALRPADPGGGRDSGGAGDFGGGRDPDDVALVLHTSGTTSRPKIVPIRHCNLVRSAANIAGSLAMTARDRSLNVMPLFHIHGLLAGLLAPLSAGGSVICTEGFDAFRFFSWLETLRPTYYTAVPTMHQMVLSRSARRRSAARNCGLRFVRSSSSSLPAPVLDELRELFGVPVIEAYGMTEATHQMCANPLPPAEAKPRSVGVPTGIDLAVLDGRGRPKPAGVRGEVAVRGPTVIDGYENNPEADRAAFASGWFRTGDEGYVDADGYLFLTGRLKEQINRGGEKISPLEVDEALLGHEAVAQAVTFAVPHPKLGEEVAAAVVTVEGASVTERELRRFLSESLAAFKVPRRVLFLDELPKGPTGKLQRIGLAERLGLGA